MLEFGSQTARLRGSDGQNALAKTRLEVGGRVTEEQLALMHERDAMAALGLIEISSRREDCDSLRDKLIKNAPKVAA